MLNDLPRRLNTGEPITAAWLNQLLDAVRSGTPVAGPGILANRDSSGTTFSIRSNLAPNAPPMINQFPRFISPYSKGPNPDDPLKYRVGVTNGHIGGHVLNENGGKDSGLEFELELEKHYALYIEAKAAASQGILYASPPELEVAPSVQCVEWFLWEQMEADPLTARQLIGVARGGKVTSLNTHNKDIVVSAVGQYRVRYEGAEAVHYPMFAPFLEQTDLSSMDDSGIELQPFVYFINA